MTEPRFSMNRRDFLRGSFGVGAAAALAACGFSGDSATPSTSTGASSTAPMAQAKVDGDLVYYNWADYCDPTVLSGFKEKYGVNIVEANYDGYAGMLAKIQAGNAYDVALPGARYVELMRKQGLIQKIDKSQFKNADQLFGWGSYFDNPWYDPNSDYSTPFSMWTTGIAYRKDKVTTATGTWQDLWNEQAKGHIYVLDEDDEALGMAALKLGLDVNTANADDLAKIKDVLISQKPYLRAYSTDDINNLASGNAWIHHAWSGDFLNFINNTATDPENWVYELPTEGSPLNSDAWVIPANAPHPGTALLWLDWIMQPDNVVKNINYIAYPLLTKSGPDTYAKMAANYPSLQVDVSQVINPTVYKNHDATDQAARNAVWTEVKAA
ncbi:MAG: spermidine/putrescine ABC transporter substrate-binding protein [Actinomycetes bacterium]